MRTSEGEQGMVKRNYWQRAGQSRFGRRGLLRAGGLAGLGAAGLALVGCSSSNNKSAGRPSTTAATQASGGQPSAGAATQTAAAPATPGRAAGTPTSAAVGALTSAQGNGKAYSAKAGDKIPVATDTFFTTTNQKKGGTFHYNAQYAGFSADPNQAYQGDFILLKQVYQGLWLTTGTSGAVVLYIAGKVEDVDPTTWVVTVRDNVKFH